MIIICNFFQNLCFWGYIKQISQQDVLYAPKRCILIGNYDFKMFHKYALYSEPIVSKI